MNPTDTEKMYLVDAGLAFNSPFPLILRPEREVDLILSFDFSARESDKADPFTELRLAADWAKLHEIPFPDINTTEIGSEDLKECMSLKTLMIILVRLSCISFSSTMNSGSLNHQAFPGKRRKRKCSVSLTYLKIKIHLIQPLNSNTQNELSTDLPALWNSTHYSIRI
ncbi:uncharacterized protein LOC132741473 [Ruditapes philippinarum]|uniref:uncharacterized protein LOC132741473 n=1 Tax=Ruditapes philippinarum TaxID=129788 RepID=UPI00295AD872|nr:uncharacterized protein LOC132741473 [Ruditapes philippinarum]